MIKKLFSSTRPPIHHTNTQQQESAEHIRDLCTHSTKEREKKGKKREKKKKSFEPAMCHTIKKHKKRANGIEAVFEDSSREVSHLSVTEKEINLTCSGIVQKHTKLPLHILFNSSTYPKKITNKTNKETKHRAWSTLSHKENQRNEKKSKDKKLKVKNKKLEK